MSINVVCDTANASNSGYQASSTGYSWAHTVVNSDSQRLFVFIGYLSDAPAAGDSVTYGGQSMSVVVSSGSIKCWQLTNPPAGANTVAVTLFTSKTTIACAVAYSPIERLGDVNNILQTGNTDGSGVIAIATPLALLSDRTVVGFLASPLTGLSAVAPTTERTGASGALGQVSVVDKVLVKNLAISDSLQISWSGGTPSSDFGRFIGLELIPFGRRMNPNIVRPRPFAPGLAR